MNCFYCMEPATHFCTACGHWLCERNLCKNKARTNALTHHPVKAVQTLVRSFLPPTRGFL
jgi:hypothetical protein